MSNTEMETAEAARPASANGLKRKQSEEYMAGEEQEHETKRQRISPGKSTPERSVEQAKEEGRRLSNGAEEIRIQNAAALADAAEAREPQQEPPEEPKSAQPQAQPPPSSTTENATTITDDQQQQQEEEPRARRKRAVKVDERQRTKRLFGSLLGSLNQPRDRTTSKRQEIEARRKAELQRQDNERIEDRQRRLEKLEEKRRRVQWEVDEENMRIRHRNLLHEANFLVTRTEPRIMYRPWELRADEEDRIDQQLDDVRDRIKKEVADFEERRRRHLENKEKREHGSPTAAGRKEEPQAKHGAHERSSESTTPPRQSENGTRAAENPDERPDSTEDARARDDEVMVDVSEDNHPHNKNGPVVGTSEHPMPDEQKADHDDGDHVVEGEEDTVIY